MVVPRLLVGVCLIVVGISLPIGAASGVLSDLAMTLRASREGRLQHSRVSAHRVADGIDSVFLRLATGMAAGTAGVSLCAGSLVEAARAAAGSGRRAS